MLSRKDYLFSFFEVAFDEHFFLSLVITFFFSFIYFFLNETFSGYFSDIIMSYLIMFRKNSDFTKFFLSHFLILSIFNIQFHIILLNIFEKLIISFIDFFNIGLKINNNFDHTLLDI